MNIDSIVLAYFSPTRTTQKILENIAEGMQVDRIKQFNFTVPEIETPDYEEVTTGLAIIGAPVYGGRLPLEAIHRFKRLRANNIPAVIVVVYGNRAYEDSLLELKSLAEELGFKPVAGGAFIGEHSLSNNDMPIAKGRPDLTDLKKAQEFGKKIIDLLSEVDSVSELSPLKLPGNFPYKERRESSKITPYTDETLCTKCDICVTGCPTRSITIKGTVRTNPDTCIRCCACIKFCPPQARYFNDTETKQIAERLYTNCSDRKEPELFF